MSLVYFDAPFKFVMHHPMFVHYAMLLIVRLPSLFVCFSRIDDDVETDEVYENSSEELAQYQATEFAGKYSLT